MKRQISVACAAVVLVGQVYAQQYVDQNGNPVVLSAQAKPEQQAKVVQYDETTNTVIEVAPQQTVQQTAPAQTIVAPAPIIVQQPMIQAAPTRRVQEQPTTVVEGSLLKESRADQLRKSRTDMETETEQKIVEKLEEARMRDEKERAERLLGNGALAPQASPTPAPAPQVMAPPVAPPTVEVISSATTQSPTAAAQAEAKLEIKAEKKEEAPQVDVKQEIRAALDEQEAAKKKEKQQIYVGAMAGMGEYPDVVNMQGKGGAGFSVGVVTKQRVVIEGSFMYSSYDIEDLRSGNGVFPVFKELTQYNTSAAVKFQVLPGSFRPFLGGLVSYTNRTYSDSQVYYRSPDASTQAIDLGVTAGLDIMINENFAVGGDFKYMTNLTSRQDSQYQQSMVYKNPNFGTPVEELQYYTLSLVGKFLF